MEIINNKSIPSNIEGVDYKKLLSECSRLNKKEHVINMIQDGWSISQIEEVAKVDRNYVASLYSRVKQYNLEVKAQSLTLYQAGQMNKTTPYHVNENEYGTDFIKDKIAKYTYDDVKSELNKVVSKN